MFGVIWAIDATLKWLPGYRHEYLGNLKQTASGQPAFLYGWFHFWINLQSGAPSLLATLTGLMETTLALVPCSASRAARATRDRSWRADDRPADRVPWRVD